MNRTLTSDNSPARFEQNLSFSNRICQNFLNMKQEQNSLHHHHHKLEFIAKFFNNPSAYVILLLLTYAFGYLSSSYSFYSSKSIPTTQHPIPPSPTILTTSLAKSTSCFDLRTQLDNFRVTTHCSDPLPPPLIRKTILDRVFNGTSPYLNFPPPHVADLLRDERVKGWGSYGAVFEHLIREVQPRTIIEIGTFLGASALHMAELTRKLGLSTQILCIDDFRGWPGFRDKFKDIQMVNGDVLLLHQFIQNALHFNVTESVLPVPFSTGSALEKLCEWGVVGDLIEIDAGHDFNSAWADINRAYRILRPGGVIFGHDYFTAADNRGVRRAVNLFAQLNQLKINTDGQHWVIRF